MLLRMARNKLINRIFFRAVGPEGCGLVEPEGALKTKLRAYELQLRAPIHKYIYALYPKIQQEL